MSSLLDHLSTSCVRLLDAALVHICISSMLKRTSVLTAYNSLQCCNICTPTNQPCSTSKTSSLPSLSAAGSTRPLTTTTRPRLRSQSQCRLQRHDQCQVRQYATPRDSHGPDFRDNMNWPCRNKSANPATPTPYEIFNLDRGAVYSKQRYYELVKLYHPDKYGHDAVTGIELTQMERLERYRLVVLAHEILSDPAKRRAYDTFGAGWDETHQRKQANRHTRGYTNASGQEYGHGPEHDASVFGNATWEDWERYYRKRDGAEKQAYAGTYINPNAFASFVILMAVLTGVVQATRAGQYSTALSEKAQAFTEETHQFMSSRAQHLSDSGIASSTDGRIKHFLEKRDPSRYGLKDEEEVTYRKHFIGDNVPPPPSAPRKTKSDSE